MKFRSAALLLSVFMLACASVGAQERVPAEARGFAGDGLHLYPLGWSSEGRWGTLIGFDGSGNSTGIRLLVIDAVTDETLFRSKPMEWSGPTGFGDFWARYGRAVLEKAASFDLEAARHPDVRDPRFITGGYEYEFIMDPASPASGAYSLKISSSRKDSKNVYSTPASRAPETSVLLGALVSPFEQRGLAVIRETDAAGTASFRFSGAHLTLGFSSTASSGSDGGGNGTSSGSGWTATKPSPTGSLISAVFNGQEYLVRSRLSAGADPDTEDSRGYTALLVAARLGHWTMVADLLDAGASPAARDAEGRSALHYASFHGDAAAVRALLDAGADPGRKDNAGRTPKELAADSMVRGLFE